MDNKERFYKIVILFLLALVLVMGLIMILRKPGEVPEVKHPPKVTKPTMITLGKIAIVIDDVGYNKANFGIIEDINKFPVTFSIIPGLEYSQSLARELTALGFQVMLHLPMEPKEKINLEPDTILTTMDRSLISSIVERDLEAIPQVRGVNNHMGSRATEDAKTLAVVMDIIKKKHLFFLDSFVTADSLAKQLAEEKNIKFAKRDVFLDNKLEPSYIRQQLEQLKKKARTNGQAVGIGHYRKTTLEVLKEELPRMQKEGFKIVFVSDLAR